MGSEIPETAKGTLAIAQALADATAKGAITVVGGGDSVAAIEKNRLAEQGHPTSRPAAAPPSSSSRARSCPASPT